MPCTLGVDVGTSGAKALVVDAAGRVLGRGTAEISLSTPRAGWAEQDPEHWVAAAEAAVRQAVGEAGTPERIVALGLTGQMHSVVFLDERDQVLHPAILWCDQRTARACQTLTERLGGPSALIEVALNKALTGFTAPKVVWLAEHEPALYARVRRLLVGKDFVRLRWTGAAATDVSDASGTLMLDIESRRWSSRLVDAAGARPEWLPEVLESHQVSGRLRGEVAARLGLPAGLPVVAGAGDQAAGALGCGLAAPGAVSVSLGTSGVVFGVVDRPLHDPAGSLHSFAHAVPGRWHGMGVVLSAGGAVRWLRDALRGGASGPGYAELDREAAAVAAGADGLRFLPYLTGERTPLDDPEARGAFAGLDLRHGRGHLARAVLEGVAFALGDCYALATRCGLRARSVRVTGGGARSRLLLEILASVLGVEVVTLGQDEGPALGAALLAAVGDAPDPVARIEERAASWVQEADRVEPDPSWTEAYAGAREQFRALYDSLRQWNHEREEPSS